MVPTFKCSLIFFGSIFTVLFIFAVTFLAEAASQVDYEKRYDNICENEAMSGTDCTFTISIPESMDSPMVYYKMGNFYANHRKYVKSRSYPQLRGEGVSKGAVSEFCSPIMENSDIPVTVSYVNNPLVDDDLAYPCALIGMYRFTDRFAMAHANTTAVIIDSGDIAHSNDKDKKFKNQGNSEYVQWLDFEDQHLMVWYQMESFPDFIKTYGMF